MAEIIEFTNPIWLRLEPLWPQPYEITVQIVYNFLDWEVPRPAYLSVFERKWLERIVGYRNRESFNYLNDTRNFWDMTTTLAIYGQAGLPENVRWSKDG